MLDARKIPYRYRDYKKQPLAVAEIEKVLAALGMKAADVLRRNDKAFKELGLTGAEPEKKLIALMAAHPTLLQRPIAVLGRKAVVGRPPERILELA